MSKLSKVLSSPVFSVFLILVCVFGFFRLNYVSNELKRERGNQAVSQLIDAKLLTRYVDMRLENDGPDAINNDLLAHVNMIFAGTKPLMMFEFYLHNEYQSLLRQLNSARSEEEKEQLVAAVRLFHGDVREIVAFADSECRIILSWDKDGTPKSSSGDNIRYAKLSNPSSKLYEEFNALIEEKVNANRERRKAVTVR